MIVRPYAEVRTFFFEGTPEEYAEARKNGENRPRRGWYNRDNRNTPPSIEHDGGLGSTVHVAICNNQGAPMWDQPLRLERVGAVTVVMDSEGRYGLVKVDRPTVKSEELYHYPVRDYSIFGRPSWENPRGFPKEGEKTEETARREAGEEIGSPMLSCAILGRTVTGNTTFDAHLTPTYIARVDRSALEKVSGDQLEKIFRVEFFTREQIEDMIDRGEIICDTSISALTRAMIRQDKMAKARTFN